MVGVCVVGALVAIMVGVCVVGALVAIMVGVCVVGALVAIMVGNGVDNAVVDGGKVGMIMVGPWVGRGMLAGDSLPGVLVGKSLLFDERDGALEIGVGVGATVTGGADVPLVLGSMVGPLVRALVIFNEDGARLTDGANES
jgi:hypothetical protein